jgi:hypothetical protein
VHQVQQNFVGHYSSPDTFDGEQGQFALRQPGQNADTGERSRMTTSRGVSAASRTMRHSCLPEPSERR